MSSSTRMSALADLGGGRPLTGWKVLAIFLAFFGTIAVANGALVYFALSTFSGEVETNPYQHGLDYGRDIDAARAQDTLRWQATAQVVRDTPDAPARIEIALRDAEGKPLTGLSVVARLEFPADKHFDRHADLVEQDPGIYRGEAPVRTGQWEVVFLAKRDGATLFQSRNRVMLR